MGCYSYILNRVYLLVSKDLFLHIVNILAGSQKKNHLVIDILVEYVGKLKLFFYFTQKLSVFWGGFFKFKLELGSVLDLNAN